jgi:hypothetical protein
MKKIAEDILVGNYAKFKKRLITYIGEEQANAIVEAVGGEEAVTHATYASDEKTGLAYNGSFIKAILQLTTFAVNLNKLLPENKQVDNNTLIKIALISQITKVALFAPNDNKWEIENRGVNYKFNNLEGALRVGERSALLALQSGVTLTPTEFEAMRIMDKANSDDKYADYFSSVLSTIIKQANELVNVTNRQ